MWNKNKKYLKRAFDNEINQLPFIGLFSGQNARVIVRDIFS